MNENLNFNPQPSGSHEEKKSEQEQVKEFLAGVLKNIRTLNDAYSIAESADRPGDSDFSLGYFDDFTHFYNKVMKDLDSSDINYEDGEYIKTVSDIKEAVQKHKEKDRSETRFQFMESMSEDIEFIKEISPKIELLNIIVNKETE